MAIAYVQDQTGSATSGTTVVNSPALTATVNPTLIVTLEHTTVTTTSIADNGTTHYTWTLAIRENTGGIVSEVWLGTGGIGATLVTATLSATTSSSRIGVSEWSGGTLVVDQTGVSAATSSTATGPTVAQSSTGGLFVVGVKSGPTILSGPTAGWTALKLAPGGSSSSASAYLISTDSASHSTTFTLNASSAYVMSGASFLVVPPNTPGRTRSTIPLMRAANYMKRASGLLTPRERITLPRLAL